MQCRRFQASSATLRDFRDIYKNQHALHQGPSSGPVEPSERHFWIGEVHPEQGPGLTLRRHHSPSFGAHSGAELRFAREALGLSVEQLGQLVGLPVSKLRAWERGEIRSVASLRKLARVVGKLHETRVLAFARARSQPAGSAMNSPAVRVDASSAPSLESRDSRLDTENRSEKDFPRERWSAPRPRFETGPPEELPADALEGKQLPGGTRP